MLSVSPVNTDDITAYWTFDTDTADTTGAFVGTLNNGATITANGVAGNGLTLDGVDDYFSIGNPEDMQILNEITLSAWIVPETSSGTQNIIAKGYSIHPKGEIFLRIADGEYQVGSWDGTNYYAHIAVDPMDVGQWIQLTGVYDGTSWRLYKNGVEVASLSSAVGAVPVNANWSIGSNGAGNQRFFNGKIGSCGIYDHALDAQAVATLMTDSQTTARVGGNPYAIKEQSYQLQLEASNSEVVWTINWGDGMIENYYNVSSAGHIYSNSGTASVTVTASRNGKAIDVTGSTIALQIGSVGEMVTNGDFEDVVIPNGTYWAIYGSLPGWSGSVEIQGKGGNKIAELDTDSRNSDLDPSQSDHQPHHTTITSDTMTFIPGLIYTLTFDAWNRSNYAQDNLLNVSVPGTIIEINDSKVSTLQEDINLCQKIANNNSESAYSYVSIGESSVIFSAGGTIYKVSDDDGRTTDISGVSPFDVSSITFIADSDSGSVSFSDVSSDVVPCFGPLLDNISIEAKYIFADIDVDSNNDGVIDDFDDVVEMGGIPNDTQTNGYIVLAGEEFSVNLSTISSSWLDNTLYGVRLKDSTGILNFDNLTLYQTSASVTALQAGQTTLTCEIYELSTQNVVTSDEVLITINTPPHLRTTKDNSDCCKSEGGGYEGDESENTPAVLFHNANISKSEQIKLNSYFHDFETPDKLTYSICTFCNSKFATAHIKDTTLIIDFTEEVGETSVVVQATDPQGASTMWEINLYNVRVIGYTIEESYAGGNWGEVEDSADTWALLWGENDYRWTPILEGDVGKNHVISIEWYNVNWEDRTSISGNSLQYEQAFLSVLKTAFEKQDDFLKDCYSLVEGEEGEKKLENGTYAIIPKLQFDSTSAMLLNSDNSDESSELSTPFAWLDWAREEKNHTILQKVGKTSIKENQILKL